MRDTNKKGQWIAGERRTERRKAKREGGAKVVGEEWQKRWRERGRGAE